MSELTRAQVRALVERGADLRQQSQKIRRELDALTRKMARTGIVADSAGPRKAPAKKKAPK